MTPLRRTLLLASLLAGLAARAQGPTGPAAAASFSVETFGARDPAGELGLFEPLPAPDYPEHFRFDMARFMGASAAVGRYREFRNAGSPAPDPETDWNNVLERAEQLLESHPREVRNIRGLAMLYALAGRYDRAARNFARYLDQKPDDLAVLGGFAQTLFHLARFDDARSALQRALDRNPDALHLRFTSACLDVALGKANAEARARWSSASLMEIETVANWLNVDRLALRQTLGDEGFRKLAELLIGPGAAGHLPLLPACLADARAAMRAGRWRDALDFLGLAERQGVSGLSLGLDRAQALFMNGEAEASLTLLRRLATAFPRAGVVRHNLGLVLIQRREGPAAAAAFQEAVDLEPARMESRFGLACALAVSGKLDEAFTLLGVLKQAHPDRFPGWMEGDDYFLRLLREDPRFLKLP